MAASSARWARASSLADCEHVGLGEAGEGGGLAVFGPPGPGDGGVDAVHGRPGLGPANATPG